MPVAPERIVQHLEELAERPLKPTELARRLGVARADYPAFRKLLRQLEHEGLIYRVKGKRLAVPDKINLVVGRLQVVSSGAGFVVTEDGDQDLLVPAHELGSAVDGDRVVARVERRQRGRRLEGRIIKVLKRARTKVVGTYHPAGGYGFISPNHRKLNRDVFVPAHKDGGASAGDLVVACITDWGERHRGPTGEVESVLGRPGQPGVDVLAIIHDHELPLHFPPEVEEAAEEIQDRGTGDEELGPRRDLRNLCVFTIDPEDAQDHDDALSIRRKKGGLWEVGIHIADVGAYVPEDGIIDMEAARRGTSIYLVDRVLPMLPPVLSSQLCSLKPGEDRLALSLLVVMDDQAKVREYELVRSTIRSRCHLSYDQAQSILEGETSAGQEVDDCLKQLLTLSRELRKTRAERGSLDFDLVETRVVLNARGEPTDVERVLRLDSHRVIEDFMLLANQLIATRASQIKLPFIYRIHEPPAPDRLEQLSDLAATFGLTLRRRGSARPQDLRRLLSQVEGKPEGPLLSTATLRSMKQARYSAENVGHFGLATEHYTHFTSPIRRYPDLVIHRIAGAALVKGEAHPRYHDEDELAAIAEHSSHRERIAEAAERDSVDLKKVEFMERHLGSTFHGTVSGVTAFGFFVLIDDYHVEGLVHVSSLDNDYYVFFEDQYSLVGERTRTRFRLGDRVRVQVAAVDRHERQVDFLYSGGP